MNWLVALFYKQFGAAAAPAAPVHFCAVAMEVYKGGAVQTDAFTGGAVAREVFIGGAVSSQTDCD